VLAVAKRFYYRESDVKYGRPKLRIASATPAFFQLHDTSGWTVRRFLKELVQREVEHDWRERKASWNAPAQTFERQIDHNRETRKEPDKKAQWHPPKENPPRATPVGFDPLLWKEPAKPGNKVRRHTSEEKPPWYIPGNFEPLSDLDEINRFLCRPPPVGQIESVEGAKDALSAGMVLVAVDPHTPDLEKRLAVEAKKVRQKYPLAGKRSRGRPNKSGDSAGLGAEALKQWRAHRIIELHELRLAGYDPRKKRKQVAAWLFPEQKNQRRRGEMLDRAVKLLDAALASTRVIDAQTR
jgi:hypothetical protein